MKGLDLKKFKKMSSDGKCTTLKHADGHELRIAHSALPKNLRSELDKIPSHEEPKKTANGGPVKMYAQGAQVEGGDSSDSQAPVVVNVNSGPPQPPIGSYEAQQAAMQKYKPQPYQMSPEEQKGNGYLFGIQQPEAPQAQAPLAQAPQPAEPMEGPKPASLAPPEEAPAAEIPSTPAPAGQPQAISDNSAVQPQEQAPAESDDYQKTYADVKQAHQKQFAQEDVAFAHDLQNGHITPETYHSLFAKKDTLGKIGTIFGLMLSGAGSGLSHQPNALLGAMNQEINNDLQAQLNSKNNAQNFIKLNQAQQMQNAQIPLTEAQSKAMMAEANLKTFTTAQLQANQAALHNQAIMVQKMPEGPQKEQAKNALAMMGTAVTSENARLADIAASKLALMGTLGGGNVNLNTTGLRLAGMKDMAENLEKKTVPGMAGQAAIDIPQDTRERIAAQKQYDEKAREYVQFAKEHSKNWTNLNPVERQKIANQGGAMAANLQSLYRNKIKGGVYKKGEQEFIEQIIPDQPTKWSSSFNAIPKVEQTIHDNENDLKNTTQSVGLKYSPKENAQKSSGNVYKDGDTGTFNGKPVVRRNGKWEYR